MTSVAFEVMLPRKVEISLKKEPNQLSIGQSG